MISLFTFQNVFQVFHNAIKNVFEVFHNNIQNVFEVFHYEIQNILVLYSCLFTFQNVFQVFHNEIQAIVYISKRFNYFTIKLSIMAESTKVDIKVLIVILMTTR